MLLTEASFLIRRTSRSSSPPPAYERTEQYASSAAPPKAISHKLSSLTCCSIIFIARLHLRQRYIGQRYLFYSLLFQQPRRTFSLVLTNFNSAIICTMANIFAAQLTCISHNFLEFGGPRPYPDIFHRRATCCAQDRYVYWIQT